MKKCLNCGYKGEHDDFTRIEDFNAIPRNTVKDAQGNDIIQCPDCDSTDVEEMKTYDIDVKVSITTVLTIRMIREDSDAIADGDADKIAEYKEKIEEWGKHRIAQGDANTEIEVLDDDRLEELNGTV